MKYEGVSDELVERIARDVRAWDKSRTPEVATANSLGKLQETAEKWADDWHEARMETERLNRRSIELDEIRTVAYVLSLGHSPEVDRLRSDPRVALLLNRYTGERS